MFVLYSLKKRAETVKYFKKKSSKIRDDWMEALADKAHKQGEHTPQHCYISHNHIYIP